MQNKRKFILRCNKKGMPQVEISKLVGLSKQRVHQIISGYFSPNKKPKEIKDLKNLTKRKRISLGLPMEVSSKNGGLDFIREIVRKRDRDTCQKCFKKWEDKQRKFDVHHLDIKMEGKKNIKYDRENLNKLITYCHKCHLNLHTVKIKMKRRNLTK